MTDGGSAWECAAANSAAARRKRVMGLTRTSSATADGSEAEQQLKIQ
jgi:hypothetical protein